MSKGLEAFKELLESKRSYCTYGTNNMTTQEMIEMNRKENSLISIIEKELKALEIIKEKNVDINVFKLSNNWTEYNHHYIDFVELWLMPEEYVLLKEVL